ncbi:AraC family transcriptional regulator [Arthrobacter sp. MYb211]|uniref:AraC family transcriptional regulator n=1 Tax=unclassified Arthrobacter TaxID=235627 RepID=UPI000CFB1449|nr:MULTISPECIES: AraC family transcriptional regulator [unclassified Arthrobacter]PRA11943.1 AraC family transcriptional regulator [Arthrobacter sp. MYb221]PRC08405.1 AraC family transcriptional regulator [Arthrobacter sp. MYb211]
MSDLARVWHPQVPLVQEVLHARFEQHAYPAHTHDSWTVLLIDEGAVSYKLDRTAHAAIPASITLLPPGIAHDGRSAIEGQGFRKRVLYLEPEWVDVGRSGLVADHPRISQSAAVATVKSIHQALSSTADGLAAENGVLELQLLVSSCLGAPGSQLRDVPLARKLRSLLDEHLTDSFTLAEAGIVLDAHPSHLVRTFSQAYGIAPHRYVTGRRVDLARRLLRAGKSSAEAAITAGFHDQPHMIRHFRNVLGATPGTFIA